MGRPVYSLERVAVYRALSPILMLPRVWIQFLAASISWVFLAIAAVWSWNATIYWVPTFALGAFALVVPFQESQQIIISLLERIFETVDAIFNEVYFPIAEDIFYIFQPICWVYNFIWDLIIPLFEIGIYNHIKLVLLMAFPQDPLEFLKSVKMQANGFPIGFTIDTSGSPDWVVGPYGKRRGEPSDPAFRYVLDKSDPIARFLVRWLDARPYDEGVRHGRLHPDRPGVVGATFFPGELERWADPRQPPVVRRAAGEAILRRVMDRSLGLEAPSWWEERGGWGDDLTGGADNATGPVDARTRWGKVFGVPLDGGAGPRGDQVGIARMDGPFEVPAAALDAATAAKLARRRDLVGPGAVGYRFVALGPQRREIVARDHSFPIFMEVAGFLNDLVGNISWAFVQFLRISTRIGLFLYSNLRDFFTDAVDFIVNIFNQIWAEFLNLPCLKFDSFAVFAISMMDCICGPLTQAIRGLSSNLERWFNYSRPSGLGGVPQAFLGCVGLGCIQIDLLTQNPLTFIAAMMRRCMGLPHQAACCIVNPIGCFMNLLINVLNCQCPGNWSSVRAPQCAWIMGPYDRWIKCLIIWLNNNIIYKVVNKNACLMGGCPDLVDIGRGFIDCIAATLLDVGFFISKLVSKVLDELPSFPRRRRRNVDEADNPTLRARNPPHTATGPPRARIADRGAHSAGGFPPPSSGGSLARLARDPARAGGLPEEYRHSALMRRLYANSLVGEAGGSGFNRSELVARYGPHAMTEVEGFLLQAESTGHFEFELSDQNAIAMAEMRLMAEAYSYGDDDDTTAAATTTTTNMEGGEEAAGVSQGWLPDSAAITAPLIKLLEATVGEESRDRHRARTQAYADRRFYSNPYIRAATSRIVEIARDLADFMEFRLYGPDPFVQPARDADPRRDIRAVHREMRRREHRQGNVSARYMAQTADSGAAYVMHVEDVLESPYHAGLYKVLFQVALPQQTAAAAAGGPYGDGSGGGGDTNLAAWLAMRQHMDDPYFHIGRLMAGSRQIIMAYGEALREVWWDADSFSFHFPSTPQIAEIYLRSHIQAYSDDMRNAMTGVLTTAAAQGEQMLDAELRRAYRVPAPRGAPEAEPRYVLVDEQDEQDLELRLDPEGALPMGEEAGLSPMAQRYSWLVQTEIAARTIITRLLAPSHIDAMLDEVATSSPLHAVYAERMRERVAILEEVSPHHADPLNRQSMRALVEQFRDEVEAKDRRLRAAGFRGIHLAEPEEREVEERELLTRDGAGANTTRIEQPDEGWRHYGDGEFREGQRLRFADGRSGTFVGTVRSVAERTPGLSAAVRSGALGDARLVMSRATVIGTIVGTVQQVVQFIMSNWEWIASLFMMVVASPPGRVVWETYLFFGWEHIVKPLFREGLWGIFTSVDDILDLMTEFLFMNNAIIYFLLTEILRFLMCWAWGVLVIVVFFPFKMVLTFISGGLLTPILFAITWAIILIAFFLPYCPPPQVFENNRMQQTIFQYVDDIIMCFGSMSIGSINIGKGAYNGECATPLGCPGRAPCTCENKGGQYSSIFLTFEDNTPCGTEQAPNGQCICWPKLQCQFMFPRFDFQRFFDVDCAEEYGYNITGITWYQTSDYFLIAYNAYRNFWIALTYLARIATSAPGMNPILFTLLIGLGFLVVFYLSLYLGAVILGFALGMEYVLPLWKRIVLELLLPMARSVEDGAIWPFPPIAVWLAGFLRFPNYKEDNPLGSPGSGEGTCFIFNSPTTIGGGAVTFWFWATVIAIVWYGFGPIFWLSFHHLAAPFRSAWALVWYVLQLARKQKQIEAIEGLVRQKMPRWLRRGARRTKTAGDALWRYTSPIRGALAPREPLHPLKDWIDSTVPALEHRHVFGVDEPAPAPPATIVDGRLRGWGAGTLEDEIYPTTLLGADQRRPLRPRAALRRGTVPPHLRKRMARRRSRRASGETPREAAPPAPWPESESEKSV